MSNNASSIFIHGTGILGGFSLSWVYSYKNNILLRKTMGRHGACIFVGYLISDVFARMNDQRILRKMKWYEDYIKVHPELFPQPPRKKYEEVFQDWMSMYGAEKQDVNETRV